MGLLFNTVETMRMVQRLNKHFAADSEGGKIIKWRTKKAMFKKGGTGRKNLNVIAANESVVVDPIDDDNQGSHNKKWIGWLTDLYSAPCTTLSQFHPTYVPASSATSSVGMELAHLIWQGLDDAPDCKEIVISVVPSTTIAVDEAQLLGTASSYTLLITVHTVEAKAMKAAISKIVRIRRAAKAKKKL